MKRFLLTAALLLATALTLAPGRAQAADEWRLVMKNYSYELAHKGITFFETVDRAAKDGFKAMEVKPSQKIGGGLEGTMDLGKMDKATLDKVLAKCKEAGIQIVGFGVARPKDEAEAKAMFENCKAAGVQWVVMEPEIKDLEMLDKLANEYKIAVAIHNHPLPSIYWNPETVLTAIKGRSNMIGACADTGHWLRSGLNPTQCLKELDGHIIMLHFKDVIPNEPAAAGDQPAKAGKADKGVRRAKGDKAAKGVKADAATKTDRAAKRAARGDKAAKGDRKNGKKGGKKAAGQQVAAGDAAKKIEAHDVAWGTGGCNVPAMMAELKRQGFKGDFSIEYEYGQTLDENIPQIIKYFNEHKDKSQAELEAEAAQQPKK